MSYLGIPPFGRTSRTVTEVVATSGQTTFYPTGGYAIGYIDVVLNGIQLNTNQYTATDRLSIVLLSPAAVNDKLHFTSYSVNFVDIDAGVLATVGVTGSYSDLLNKPTTISGYGITDAQPLDADLTAIAVLTGTSGLLKKTAANTWSLDTSAYLTAITSSQVTGALGFTPYNSTNPSGYISGNQTVTFSGDASGSGTTSVALTLANSGVTAGTYGSTTNIPQIAVDAKGRITSVTNVAVSIPSGSITFTGDVTGTGTTGSSTALTLANSGVVAGTYTKTTVDAKGRVTSGTTLSASDIPGLDASKITSGTIDAARLPSYVDDVLEYANLAAFPATGETGKIFVALDTNKTYRWSGSAYVYITSGAVDSVAGKTGVVSLTSSDVGLGNVENKSSATIRSEISSANVTGALGFTPYNSTNPSGYTNNTGTVTSVAGTGTVSGLTLTGTVSTTGSLTLGGTLSLTSANVTGALGFTPYNSTNPSGYITGITSANVTTALGFTPYNSTNPSGYITSSALSGYLTTSTATSTYLPLTGGTLTGAINASGTSGSVGGYFGTIKVGYGAAYGTIERTDSDLYLQYNNAYNVYTGYGGGFLYAYNSARSPIFYDSNNTAYYLDPASFSNLNEATFQGYIGIGGNGPSTAMSGTSGVSIYHANYPSVGFSTAAGPNYLIYRQGSGGPLAVWNSTGNETFLFRPTYTQALANITIGSTTVAPNRQLTFSSINEDAIQIRRLTTSQGAPAVGTGISWTWTSAGTDTETWAAIRAIMPGSGNSFLSFSTTPTGGGGAGLTERLNIADSGVVTANVDIRSPIFYDSNNTGYYIDAASVSNLNILQLTGALEQGNNYAHPNVEWAQSGDAYGEVIFYLPGTTNNYGMVHMVFDIYEYNSPRTATVTIGGHNWSTSWYNTACDVVGYTDKQVRVGVKDGRFVVVFGTTGSTWSYGQVRLRKIQNGSYYNNAMDLAGNWSAAITTTESFSYISGDLRALRTPGTLEAWGTIYGYTDVRSPIFYDYNDTGYYIDPASTSNTALRMRGGALFGPNTTWGAYLAVGGNGNISTSYASVATTNGNLHMDAASGYEMYLNYYAGSGIQLGNGSNGIVARIHSDGTFRSPIFYDYNDTGYYVDPASTSNLNKLSALTMSYNDMNSMSVNSPYANRYGGSVNYRNGTMGYGTVDFNTMFSNWGSGFIDSWSSPANAPGGSSHYVGLQGAHYNHQNSYNVYGFQMACAGEADNRFFWRSSWATPRSWVEMIHTGNINSQADLRAPVFYDSNDTGYYIDPNGTTNLNQLNVRAGVAYTNLTDVGASTAPVRVSHTGTGTGDVRWIPMIAGTSTSPSGYSQHTVFGSVRGTVWGSAFIGVGGNDSYPTVAYTFHYEGYGTAPSSWRAPIFYDSDNTGYYVDPNSYTSLYGGIQVLGAHGSTRSLLQLPAGNNGASTGVVALTSWCSEPGISWDYAGFGYNAINDGGSPSGFSRINPNFGQAYMRFSPSGSLIFYNTPTSGSNYTTMALNSFGDVITYQNLYTRRMYDLDNTDYYVNPASTTNLNVLTLNGVAITPGGGGGDAFSAF